jgi:hypothetical protein
LADAHEATMHPSNLTTRSTHPGKFYLHAYEEWCSDYGAFSGCATARGSTDWHLFLDVLGLIPGVGEIADGVNAIIYAAEGDWVNASISVAGAVPGAGNAVILSKLGKRAYEACNNSFDPETPVLMADGTSKRIKEIKEGDKVVAADEETGKRQGGRAVTALHANPHNGDLIDIDIDRNGDHVETIQTTFEHPFWDATIHAWVVAGALTAGHALQDTDGHAVRIRAVRHRPGAATMLNLTVNQLHTYYVLAGGTPVLVHNCDIDQGVYVFTDKKSGLPYVGQTNKFDRRLKEHVTKSGRRDPNDHVICIHVCGDQNAREAVEDELIEELGGIENLGNDINSPGRSRR